MGVIVPGFARGLKSGSSHGPEWPQLALLAGRGSLARRWDRRDFAHGALAPWQRGLLEHLDLAASAAQYASAPTTLAATWNEPSGGYWMHAEPVHFAAGLDSLTFIPLEGAAAVTATEREALRQHVAEHLLSADLELHGEASEWIVHSRASLALELTCPETAAAGPLEESLPRGANAGAVRRLMTELQMLLHDHPVNQQRARQGLPDINAVWFWGGGSFPAVAQRHGLPVAFADEPYVRGLYRLHEQDPRPPLEDADQLLAHTRGEAAGLAVVSSEDPAYLESAWFGPLARALGSGRLGHLDLVLDDWHLSVGRFAWRRFWRGSRFPDRWPDGEYLRAIDQDGMGRSF